MKKIPLTQGQFALVDDEDFEELSKYKWCAHKSAGSFYATHTAWLNGKGKTIRMHTMIMGTPKGLEVDHIDRNKLNNQRSNLRVCTHAENERNKGISKQNTSGLKGVFYSGGRWQSQIKLNGKAVYLGSFSSKEDAYKAYCEVCVKYHGEFARVA